MAIHAQYGVEPIINASGPVTRLGGAPLRSESVLAFASAAGQSLVLEEVQAAASRRICQITMTEAALVTSGAAAGLLLGTAAILCRHDLRRMDQLPQIDGPVEFVVPRGHRHGYDHALRTAGARLVEVGLDEVQAHAGVRRTELWELEAALGPNTAGVFYTYHSRSQPPLAEVVQLAHRHQLPVLVDAAAQLPPVSNLAAIVASGADLVVFSGGKAIGGPQATGILCGKRNLVGSAFLQMMDQDDHYELWSPPLEFVDKSELRGLPRHGIGRALKVSQEQIFAFLAAFDTFVEESSDDERWLGMLKTIEQALHGLSLTKQLHLHRGKMPELHITLPTMAKRTALELCRMLRMESPRIFVGHSRLPDNVIVINPACLQESQAPLVGQRIADALK